MLAASRRLHEQALSLQEPYRRSGAGEEPDEIQDTLEGGARVWSDEAEVWVREGTLSRPGEERQPVFTTCALVNLFMVRKKAAVLCSVVSPNRGPTAGSGGSEGREPRGDESVHLNLLLGVSPRLNRS